ncbi:MAG: FTR1 family protein [Candidatus Gracilibacteria bacterium]|nr:FTR1 family protein [Candidatus Gracilibacteria bacterium]
MRILILFRMAAFLVTFRETFEIVLLLSLLLGGCQNLLRQKTFWMIVLGSVLGIGVSLAGAWGLQQLAHFDLALWEGMLLLATTGLLTHAIFYSNGSASGCRSARLIFLLTFLCVAREGMEVVLFLSALSTQVAISWWLAGLGAGAAVLLGAGLIRVGRLFPVRKIFALTAGALVLLATFFLFSGISELQEADVVPMVLSQVHEISLLPILLAGGYFFWAARRWWRQISR